MTEDEILSLASMKAKRGEYFTVHKYKYRDEKLRQKLRKMSRAGKLVFGGLCGKEFEYYRPEDIGVIKAAQIAHENHMKTIHAKNVNWHLEQAEKYARNKDDPESLYSWHIQQAEEQRRLSL